MVGRCQASGVVTISSRTRERRGCDSRSSQDGFVVRDRPRGSQKRQFGKQLRVSVPGIPGVITAGDTLDEALRNAREAIEFRLEAMLEDGQKIVTDATDIGALRTDPDHEDATWERIDVDLMSLEAKVRRGEVEPFRLVLQSDDSILGTVNQSAAFRPRLQTQIRYCKFPHLSTAGSADAHFHPSLC
jgi:hypothetical protein